MISEKRYFVSEEIRPLSQRSDIMGFVLVLHCYSLITIPLVFFSLWPNFFTFFLAIIVIGSRQLGLAILMHDAAHRALFEKKFLNENGYDDCAQKVIPTELQMAAQNIYKREFNKHSVVTQPGKIFIDKLPLNLLEAPLIHRLYPDAKFILVLRHPMDSILSCWMQNFKLNSANVLRSD